MNRFSNQLSAPNVVAAGSTSVFTLPTDRRYHTLFLHTKAGQNQAAIEADITKIRLKINEIVIRSFTPNQLFTINAMNGQAFTNSLIPIFFSEPWARTKGDEDILAWGMSNVNSFQIEVDIAGGAAAPELSGFAETDEVQEPFAGIVSWYDSSVDVTATGVKQFSPSIRKQRELLKALHCFEAADGDITNLRISLDNLEIYNLSATDNLQLLAVKGIADQNGVISFRPDRDRRLENYLPLMKANGSEVSEYKVEATMANASTFRYIQEVYGTPQV